MKDLLHHETRQRIVEEVQHHPGMRKGELRRRLDVSWGTLLHHVWMLERHGRLTTRTTPWQSKLYLTGDPAGGGRYHAWLSQLHDIPAPPSGKPARDAEHPRYQGGTLRERPRGQETRAAMLRLVKDDPGINLSEVSRRLVMSWGAVWHHARHMEQGLSIIVHRTGQENHLFPADMPNHEIEWLSTLQNPRRQKLVELLMHGVVDRTEVCRSLGIGDRMVRKHVKALYEAGFLHQESWALTSAARAFLLRQTRGQPAMTAAMPA